MPPERMAKWIKTHHYSPEVVVEITDQNGELKSIRALLDTGTSATILLRDFLHKGRAKTKHTKNVECSTMGGTFVTNLRKVQNPTIIERIRYLKVWKQPLRKKWTG